MEVGSLADGDIVAPLARYRLVPVVVFDDAADVSPLAQALVDGGLPVAEVTFRTDPVGDAIAHIAERGDALGGVGTVPTPTLVDLAVDAVASYIVPPGRSRA